MNPPSIEHIAKDEGNNLTFRIMAYRKLADDEVAAVVEGFLKRLRGPKLRNQTVTIQTVIGTDPTL